MGNVFYNMIWIVGGVFLFNIFGVILLISLLAVLVVPFFLLLFSTSSGKVTSFLDTTHDYMIKSYCSIMLLVTSYSVFEYDDHVLIRDRAKY